MFVLSNTYQLKDLKNNIFNTIYDAKSPISFFVSTGEIKAFSIGTELFSYSQSNSKKIADLKSPITCLQANNNLICAGTHNGQIHIFSEHRAAIRQFKNHVAEITDIFITPSNLVISAGKDDKINFYNLEEGILTKTIKINSGYIRKIAVIDQYLYLFSKNISVYSLSDYKIVKEISFGQIIDHAIQISENKILFTSNNKGYLLDLHSYNLSTPVVLHSREITMVQRFEKNIYTSSLDGHFKSFNPDLKCISDFYFPNKVTSFIIENGIPFIITYDGLILSIDEKKDVKEQRKFRKSKPAYEDEIEFSLIPNPKKRLTVIESLLQNYQFKKAFNYCISKNDISQIYSVLKFIHEKRFLNKLTTDIDLQFLKNLLYVCLETIKIQEFTPIILEILIIISSRYYDEITYNDDIKELIHNISNELDEIVAFEETYNKALSFLDSFS